MRPVFFPCCWLWLARFAPLWPAAAQPDGAQPACSRWTGCCPKSAATIPASSMTPMVPPTARAIAHYHLKWMTPDGRIDLATTPMRAPAACSALSPGRDSFDGPGTPRSRPHRHALCRGRRGGYGSADRRRLCVAVAISATDARLWLVRMADVMAAAADFGGRGRTFGGGGDGGGRGGGARRRALRGQSMRILLVEDDKDLQRLLKKALGDAGYVVDTRRRWRGRPFPGRHRTL